MISQIVARASRILLLIPTLWLASCAPNDETRAVILPRVGAVLSEKSPVARKAAIRAQLAVVCPTPLSDDELEWAAAFVDENQSKGATWIAGRLLRLHREARICRGQ